VIHSVDPKSPYPNKYIISSQSFAGCEIMVRVDNKVALRFTFISEPEQPVVTVQVPKDMLFQEALVLAAKKQGKDPGLLSATYPAGTPITGGTVEKVIEQGSNIHVIDPSVVG
jgi:hypothetical protein